VDAATDSLNRLGLAIPEPHPLVTDSGYEMCMPVEVESTWLASMELSGEIMSGISSDSRPSCPPSPKNESLGDLPMSKVDTSSPHRRADSAVPPAAGSSATPPTGEELADMRGLRFEYGRV
jgi:hypothetical protein